MDLWVDIVIWTTYIISLYFSVFLLLVYLDKRKVILTEHSVLEIPQYPFVSILVPAYNEEKTIRGTLESIEALEYPKEKIKVLVINDGSRDGTEEVIKQYIKDKPYFKLLSQQNRGKAASLNRAMEQAKGEFFACLDADSFVHPHTLRKMLAFYYAQNDPKLAIITPAMKVSNPKNMLQKVQWLEYLVLILIARLSSFLDALYVAPGPFSLYRTEIIKSLGGFDEKNITEDQEIAYRVQCYNYKIKQCFDGYVYTTAPHKIKPFYRQRRRWYLGSVICLHKYRKMVANKRYGDFGVMQMTKNIVGYLLAFAGILTSFYFIFNPLWNWLRKVVSLQFSVGEYVSALNINVNKLTFLLVDIQLVSLFVLLFAVGFFFFYMAHRNADEKMMKFGFVPLIPYFAFYYLLKGSILLITFIEFSRGKKIRW